MILGGQKWRAHVAAAAALLMGAMQVATPQALPKNFVMHEAAQPVPAIGFADAEGRSGNIAEFKGRVVVANIWATWCVPCRTQERRRLRLEPALSLDLRQARDCAQPRH